MRAMSGCEVAGGELFEHAQYLQRAGPVGEGGFGRVDARTVEERRPAPVEHFQRGKLADRARQAT